MGKAIELSIIVLCYRSEEAIIQFAEKVKQTAGRLTDRFQIVLVGNYIEGSKDRTKEIVQQIANKDSCFKAIYKPKKGMMGWDMKEGLTVADGEYLCVIDGDGQFPIESIERCYKEIKTGKYDLVKTYRSKRHDGFYRTCISRMYNIIFSVVFYGLKSKDINSKPKMIRRKALDRIELKSKDWFIDAEIMINIRRLNMKFFEFPIEFYENTDRASFVKFQTIVEFIKNIIVYRVKEFRISKNAR